MRNADVEPRFRWAWHTDDSGEHARVIWYSGDRPEGVEVCRMTPGKTDDRPGCVIRALVVCEAMASLAKHHDRLVGTLPPSTS